MLTNCEFALTNLLKTRPDIRPGGLRDILHLIDRQIGLPIDPSIFPCSFAPKATRWDRGSRTVHLYEIPSPRTLPEDNFQAIRDFARLLHGGCGCHTSLWITDGDGLDPVKVWDMRDELIWVQTTSLPAVA